MIEIISIHIPKTAGRSLLNVFIQAYGEDGVLVVNRKLFRESREKGLQDIRNRITSSTKVIHGHVHVSDILPLVDDYPSAKLITFIREPMSRLLSHYRYELHIFEERGRISGIKTVPVDSFVNYATHEESRNLTHRFLSGISADKFFFIGRTEYFDYDVRTLQQKLDWEPVSIPHENITSGNSPVALSHVERAEIIRANEADFDLYKKLVHDRRNFSAHKISCWIASFPRSGNTFFRNILYYVYGIESGTWHKEPAFPVDDDYDQYAFVKTHLLPHELVPDDPSIPAIYLIRDGRDAMVSIAHQRSELVEPGSDYESNLQEAIVAAEGSYFGGWSAHVKAWLPRAEIIIRYEDLITDPKAVFQRVEKFIALPKADWSRLPSFEEMKKGKPKYGGTTKLPDPKFNPDEFARKFFRRGKSGSWRDEMPPNLQQLFRNYHGETLEMTGYEAYSSQTAQNSLLDYRFMLLSGKDVEINTDKRITILIEASKLLQQKEDGVKRYLVQLLEGLEEVMQHGDPSWHFDLIMGKKILPFEGFHSILLPTYDTLHVYEKVLMEFKGWIQKTLPPALYEKGSAIYRKTDARKWLKKIQIHQSAKKELSVYHELKEQTSKYDLIFVPLPQNISSVAHLGKRCAVTVHDITHKLYPEFHTVENAEMTEEGIRYVEKNNCGVIAVSENTRHDISRNYKIAADNIHVVYPFADSKRFHINTNNNLARTIRHKYNIGDSPYFLCLSTIEPRKNLERTTEAFGLLKKRHPDKNIRLVIAGAMGWKSEKLLNNLQNNEQGITFTGFIDEPDLHVLYSDALAFCYVSIYEGFGLPLLEAMRCGTPVIYGSNSSMTEVVGDAGLGVDAINPDAICNAMESMLTDQGLRQKLSVKALEHSYRFSARRSVREIMDVFEKFIQS
jgi:glycosyltransferase involved in cell wall biosynthesis